MAEQPNSGGAAPASGSGEKPFDYSEWRKTIPDEALAKLKEEVAPEFWDSYNGALEQEYGDLLPLVVEAKNDKDLREALGEFAKDKELRTFVTGPARKAYRASYAENPPNTGGAVPAGGADDATRKELESLKSEIAEFKSSQQRSSYEASRRQEFAALANEFPELRFQKEDMTDEAYRRAAFLIDAAERRSSPDKPFPYRQLYAEMQAITGRELPAAPLTTQEQEPPSLPQAPRTISDAQRRADATAWLKKNGGVINAARAIKGARR